MAFKHPRRSPFSRNDTLESIYLNEERVAPSPEDTLESIYESVSNGQQGQQGQQQGGNALANAFGSNAQQNNAQQNNAPQNNAPQNNAPQNNQQNQNDNGPENEIIDMLLKVNDVLTQRMSSLNNLDAESPFAKMVNGVLEWIEFGTKPAQPAAKQQPNQQQPNQQQSATNQQ